MLLLILKISIIFALCLLTLRLLKANGSNLKQKIIVVTFIFCLFIPFLAQSPLSFNINNFGTSCVQNNTVLNISPTFKPIINKLETISTIPQTQPHVLVSKQVTYGNILWTVFLVIWIVGVLLKFFRYIFQIYQLTVLVNRSKALKFPSSKFTQYSKNIRYLRSDETSVPFLFVGFRTINIVLPKQSKAWSEQNIYNILAHELCHYRRKDHWALWLSSLVLILYWFHPMMSRLNKVHREMIELACDQQLLSEGINPSDYAQTILSIPQINKEYSAVPLMSTQPSLIKKRINEILTIKQTQLSVFKLNVLVMVAMLTFVAGCVNNNTLLSASNLVEFISNDLPSLRTGKLDNNHIQMATFYDGVDNHNTFLELELSTTDSNQTTWLKLGPLKKFNEQIQTWHYKTLKGAELTGRYKVSNAIADGSVDGVAFGIIYSDSADLTVAHKSAGSIDNNISNILCAWPLDISNNTFKKLTPQLSNQKHETIKRLLCGSQLLKNGVYSINN